MEVQERRVDEIQNVAYQVFEKFNDFDLSVSEVEVALEYMIKRILPYQRSRYMSKIERPPFKVVIPQILS